MAMMPVVRANYWCGNYCDKRVWIVGDGRSGTTWIANIVNSNGCYREMFEPFHPEFVSPMKPFGYFKYLQPGSRDFEFEQLANSIFSGRFQHYRVDSENRRIHFSGLLIKDIFGHLFLAWAKERYPDLKIILVLRHPFDVALSKLAHPNWKWFDCPKTLLLQAALRQSHLAEFESVLSRTTEKFESLVLIWCAIHYVLLRQLKTGDVLPVFYEDLVRHPIPQASRIFSFLGNDCSDPDISASVNEMLDKPSRTGRRKNTLGANSTDKAIWSSELTQSQRHRGNELLRNFGLSEIYDTESGIPRCDADELFG